MKSTKQEIGLIVKKEMKRNAYTFRSLAEELGTSHPQVSRIASGENYTIDGLIRILDKLGLELKIEKKETSKKNFTVIFDRLALVEIEASDYEEAMQKAQKLLDHEDNLPWTEADIQSIKVSEE